MTRKGVVLAEKLPIAAGRYYRLTRTLCSCLLLRPAAPFDE